MILVFDVGNTELTIGCSTKPICASPWRVMTDVRARGRVRVMLRSLLAADGFRPEDVESVAIGSVVPRVTAPLAAGCQRYFEVGEPLLVDARAGLPIRLAVDEPQTVGADRIINTLAASRLFRCDAIVVDMGTATTFDCITCDGGDGDPGGAFIGGVISPGIATAADSLTRRTSKLPATELTMPAKAIGTHTEDCIRSGVVFGAADAIDGMVVRIKREPRPRSRSSSPPAAGGVHGGALHIVR